MRIVNLSIEKCAFKKNNWAGLSLALGFLDGSSLPVSIQVRDCLFEKNGFGNTSIYTECEIMASANDTFPVQGAVLFERCQITESDWTAFYSRKTHDAYNITFSDCAFMNVSGRQDQFNEPFFLEVPDYFATSDYIGNLTFNNCLLSYANVFPFFRVYGFSTLLGVKDITGNLTIFAPNNQGILYTAVADTVNATLSFFNYVAPPLNQVSVTSPEPLAEECGIIGKMEYTRFDNNLSFPLPIKYAITTTAVLADDVHFLTGGAVIPSQTPVFFDTIIARKDFIAEPAEEITIGLLPATHYTIVPTFAPALITIIDCASSTLPSISIQLPFIFPNPSDGNLSITVADSESITVYDITGKFITSVQPALQNVDLTFLSNGIYIIEISNTVQKIVIDKN
jgi:Secretion system C-terminal sorting domain